MQFYVKSNLHHFPGTTLGWQQIYHHHLVVQQIKYSQQLNSQGLIAMLPLLGVNNSSIDITI